MSTLFIIISIIFGLISAILWFAAAIVPTMPEWITNDEPNKATPGNFNFDLIIALTAAFRKSSTLNKWAAIATGLSVLTNTVANYISL